MRYGKPIGMAFLRAGLLSLGVVGFFSGGEITISDRQTRSSLEGSDQPELPRTAATGPSLQAGGGARRERSGMRNSKLIAATAHVTGPTSEELRTIHKEAQRAKTRSDQPAEALEFFRMKRLPEGQTSIPVEKYLIAREEMRQMLHYSTAEERFLPPLEVTAGVTQAALGTWTSLGPGNIGGRSRALLIHPTNPDILYAAGVAGGVWKSTDAGAGWTALSDMIANIAVNSMAMDPANPEVIYAGTGEGYFNGDAVRGAGIFKTTDGGMTWNHLANTLTTDFNFVNDLVVSPNSSQRVYAATRSGVWRSTDGGVNWTRVLDPAITGGCMDLAIRTDQANDFMFAACGTAFTPTVQSTIYRNTNAGGADNWTAVHSEAGMGRTALAIAPSNQNIIYAVSASGAAGQFQLGLHAVFRSTANGDPGTWSAQVRNTDGTKLNTVLLSNTVNSFLTECGFGTSQFLNQGWYDIVIAVDPLDSNRVWVGGVDLFRSDDGGVNWGQASHWWAARSNPRFVHADQHVIAFHPQYDGTTNQIMFVGNDGGLFRTNDARAQTATGPSAPCSTNNGSVTWTSLNNSYGVTQFYHGVPYPDSARYFGGTQDNGTVRGGDTTGPDSWTTLMGGDGGYVAVDPTNTNILYAEFQRLAIRKSTDGGATFFSATTGITNSGFLFIVPFIMDPSDSQRLWTGGSEMWRTTNGAGIWNQASTTVAVGSVSAIAVAPTNANSVLAGTSAGHIHRTATGLTAASSTVWPSVQPRSGFVSWLTFDPTNSLTAYATYSTFGGTHVWKSVDGGATWNGLDGTGSNTIPDVPVHSIIVDPTNTQRLYAGTDLGVFVSIDGGVNWAVENTGFANVVTEALGIAPSGGTTNLFAFTHGRGAWRVPLLTGGDDPPTITNFSPSTGCPGQQVAISGTNFTGAAAVAFNGVQARFTVDSDTQITATVPATATTGPISVTKTGQTAISSANFTVTSGPVIMSFSPAASKKVGKKIAITGTGLANATSVTFGGAAATISSNTDTQIKAALPSNAVSGRITVTVGGCTAESPTDFFAAATISSFTPTSGPPGTQVTFSGVNFLGTSAMLFKKTPASFVVVNNTTITATVPIEVDKSGVVVLPGGSVVIKITTPAGSVKSTSKFSFGL